jgi:cullin 1
LAVLVWNEKLFANLHPSITASLLRLIQQERNGEKIRTNLLRSVISSYLELGINEQPESPTPGNVSNRVAENSKQAVYKRNFEAPFLEHTREFYAKESTEFVQSHTVTEYLKKVEQRLKEELDRCILYLTQSTKDPLTKTCHEVLIKNHLQIFQSEFEQLLINERDEDLGRMYNLCEHVDGAFEKLREILEKHIEHKGRSAIDSVALTAIQVWNLIFKSIMLFVKDPKQYVNVILEIHTRYSNLVNNSFHADAGFVQAMDKSLASFVNNNRITELAKATSKSPELLARYCDMLLRKSSKNPEDRELETLLSQVVSYAIKRLRLPF